MKNLSTEPIRGRRVWTAATIDDASAWTTALSNESLDELEAHVGGEDTAPPSLSRPHLPRCAEQLAPAREELDRGRGFALVERLDEARFGRGTVAAYWALGRLLGRPFAQDTAGNLLYDVRDTGRSVADGARFSVTRAESTFHTDNAFNEQLPDFVGLLCRRAALEGGRSQLINAMALYNELLGSVDPETLHGAFWFDRRGQEGRGEPPIARRRLFTRNGDELSMRYMAYYIEVGQERAGEALTPRPGPLPRGRGGGPGAPRDARGVRPGAGADVVHQQPLDPAQPHGLHRSPGGRGPAALRAAVAAPQLSVAFPGTPIYPGPYLPGGLDGEAGRYPLFR